MKLSLLSRNMEFISRYALSGVMFISLTLTFAASRANAAELVMFEQAGCVWCAAFDRDIAPVYGKTPEGAAAPLRRVNIDRALPTDLSFIQVERLTPLFVLVDKDREIGRIRGYPGEDHFWGLLGVLIKKLNRPETGNDRTRLFENNLRARG